MTVVPPWPAEVPRHSEFRLTVDGTPVPVLACDRGAVAQWLESSPGTVEVTIETSAALGAVAIRPRRLRVEPQVSDGKIRFRMPVPSRVLVEVEGKALLCCFAEAPPSAPPPKARCLEPGIVHDLGLVKLDEGEHLNIPPGAVLRGRVELIGNGASVGGGGWIDGSGNDGEAWYSVVADRVQGARIEDLTVVNPTHWMVVVGGSTHVELQNLRLLGEVGSSDGIDVVGSSHVKASRCFVINGDDCLVVKSFDPNYTADGSFRRWSAPVRDVIFEQCVVGNFRGGSATEIGHELRCETVEDVTFRDIDVMFVHEHAAVFSMHNADRALVRRVRWEGVHIEHCFDKLIDLRIVTSRWGGDSERGRAEMFTLCDIDWWTLHYNAGHTLSVIGGVDDAHRVDDVVIKDFRLDGVPIASLDQLDLFLRHSSGIRLET